ncbi:MAG: hypothetical protein OEQ53_19390, partial [Saprospiraceae bacterium]|nr:hypothetical protein [Saprospiraceae bacterium]
MITNYPICLCMILCSLAWLSCEQSSNLSERGYQYLLHTQSEGPKPQPGEYAYFDIVMKAGDSILNTSYNMEQRPRLRMPFQEEYTSNTPALIDGLKLMSVGDSLTLFFPLDSMDVTPVAFEQYDVIEYKLKMADIKTDAQFKEEMQKTIEEKEARLRVVKARGPEVAEFSSQILDQYNAGKLSGIITTESGLKYVVHEDGSGKVPQPNDMVSVHYYGLLMNGLAF